MSKVTPEIQNIDDSNIVAYLHYFDGLHFFRVKGKNARGAYVPTDKLGGVIAASLQSHTYSRLVPVDGDHSDRREKATAPMVVLNLSPESKGYTDTHNADVQESITEQFPEAVFYSSSWGPQPFTVNGRAHHARIWFEFHPEDSSKAGGYLDSGTAVVNGVRGRWSLEYGADYDKFTDAGREMLGCVALLIADRIATPVAIAEYELRKADEAMNERAAELLAAQDALHEATKERRAKDRALQKARKQAASA